MGGAPAAAFGPFAITAAFFCSIAYATTPPPPASPPACNTILSLFRTDRCIASVPLVIGQSSCVGEPSSILSEAFYYTPDLSSCTTVDVSGTPFARPPKVKGAYTDNLCTTQDANYAELESTTPCTPLPSPIKSGSGLIGNITHYTLACSSGCSTPLVPPSTPPPSPPPKPPPPSPSPPSPGSPPAPPPVEADDPCFDRASTTACKLSPGTPAIEAYYTCFGGGDKTAMHAPAERVLMSELRAGDLVLDSKESVTRVVVNQHVHSASMSRIINIQHEGGMLSLTADHVLMVDGELRPARTVKAGSFLSGYTVHAVTFGRSSIINPITASGLILAASTTGQPILAATGNEWLADVMLSSYPKYTLSYILAATFPVTIQRFYDAVLEPLFSALVPTLTSLKTSAPQPVVYAALVSGDVALAAAFGSFAVASNTGSLLACFALVASVGRLRRKS